MTTICIVDDQHLILDALKVIFEESGNLTLIGSFNSAEAFIENYEILKPDITIMDLDLPMMSGIDAIITIKVTYPEAKFLILSNYDDDERLFNSLKAGAVGYLLKKESLENLPEAIALIHQGGAPMTPEIARKVIAYFHKYNENSLGKFQQLTEKEKLVLELLSDGLLYKEIADKMSVGIDAVKKHAQHIYEKLQVHTRSEAIKKYLTR
jgi:DNA-binding NarL/FixJ family response regulator